MHLLIEEASVHLNQDRSRQPLEHSLKRLHRIGRLALTPLDADEAVRERLELVNSGSDHRLRGLSKFIEPTVAPLYSQSRSHDHHFKFFCFLKLSNVKLLNLSCWCTPASMAETSDAYRPCPE